MYDEDVVKDDKIGGTTIKLAALCVGDGLDDWFQIIWKDKDAGRIHLRSVWYPACDDLDTMADAYVSDLIDKQDMMVGRLSNEDSNCNSVGVIGLSVARLESPHIFVKSDEVPKRHESSKVFAQIN